MRKLILIFCVAFLVPQYGAQAHQQRHVHSQWIQQQLNQMNRTIQQLRARVQQLENTGTGRQQTPKTGTRILLNETCSANEQKLCRKGCPAGWKIDQANCTGRGSIGRSYDAGGFVSCYCFGRNDPNCRVEGITAICVRP